MSKVTIKSIGEEILKEFQKECNKRNIGLWIFKYHKGTESLRTWEILPDIVRESPLGKMIYDEAKISYGEGTIGYMLASQNPVIVGNTMADPRGVVSLIDREIKQTSALCYPIISREKRLIGALDFYHSEENIFNKEHYPNENNKEKEGNSVRPILKKHIDNLSWLYDVELYRDMIKQLARPSETEWNIQSLVSEIQKFLSLNLAISLIVYKEREENKYIWKYMEPNFEFLKAKFSWEVAWCSYKSTRCKDCFLENSSSEPLSSNESCPCPEDNHCTFKTILSSIGRQWHKCKSCNLPYFALCYLKDESKETAGKMEEICKILREYMTAIEQKIEYGEKERHEVIYSFMDYFFMEGKIEEKIKRAKIILDTFKINYSNLYPLDKVIDKYSDFIKYEIVSFFLLKEEDGFIWNPSKNDDFLRFVEKHEKPWLFKYPSSIKPLYYALLGKTKLDDYPSLVTAYNIECEVSNNIITIDNGIKWEWEKGKQTRILYSFLNPSVFRDGFIELCHKCYNDDQDSPDNELIQLFDIDVSRKPLLIPGDDGNYKFIVHYQLSHAPVVEKTSSVDEENITLLETYLDHIHSLYETELHRRRGRQHALSSAVAAIMARNMSHLLGSHVEPGVQNDIPSFIEECMQSKAFKDLAKKLNEGDFNCIKSRLRNRGISKTLLETSNDSSERKEAILNLIDAKDKALERYSVYHQRRMDFIARIATEWPRWGVGYEFYRHFIFPFMSNSILLHFVGYSDGFTIENIDFSVKVNDKPIKEKYNWRMDCKRAKNNVSL